MANNKPIEFRKGSFNARIYHRTKVIRGRTYDSYTLSYYGPSGRTQREFGSLAKARASAEVAAKAFSLGTPSAVSFSPEERTRFQHAEEILKPLGKDVYSAALEYVAAVAKLPQGATLNDAVSLYVKANPSSLESVQVSSAVELYLEESSRNHDSGPTMSCKRSLFQRLAVNFTGLTSSISAPLLESWIGSGEPQNSTRVNRFSVLSTFFRFARSKKWISQAQLDEILAIPKPRVELKESVEIYSVSDIEKVLRVAKGNGLAALAIGAFAGLRSTEISKLDWKEIRFDQCVIEVKARNAKTRQRRLVPISENLRAWLEPLKQSEGPIVRLEHPVAQRNAFKAAGVKKLKNGLRHSYISYRVALTGDIPRTSLEAGNSPSIIQKHYLELVTKPQGIAWFSVVPI